MKTFGIQYPENTKYLYQSTNENLIGEKSTSFYYKTNNGTFTVSKTPYGYSSMQIHNDSPRFVAQCIHHDVNDTVHSSKVTVVGGAKSHRCKSVQTLFRDGTYKVERYIDGVEVGGYTYKPVDRTFKGLKGFLQKAIVYLTTDINGCEKARIAPSARKLLAKIRHF
jgi:hypothetical protein